MSVTVCQHGSTTNCTTIPDILLDTGSTGLRIFNTAAVNALKLPVAAASNGGQLAECITYIDNTSDWGQVVNADVVLGGEAPANVPIQIIDSAFAGGPTNSKTCPNPEASPSQAGFNGIIGVASFLQDCGSGCAKTANNDIYYSCQGNNCAGIAVAVANQVSNPVASLATDNNGLAINLPSIPAGGAATASGFLILGIGTRANNTPVAPTILNINANGNFSTTFQGVTYTQAFIDSGSNGLYFPTPSGLALCANNDPVAPGFFCPAQPASFTAVQTDGVTSSSISFEIVSADTLFSNAGFEVFDDVGAPLSGGFDWGLPFFFGRTVYVGLENKVALNRNGPFWAY